MHIRFGGRQFNLPRSRFLRFAIGILLICGGLLWFLPILGLWMIPLGLTVMSYDIAALRRLRRRMLVWWARRS